MRNNKIVVVLALCALSIAGCKKKKQLPAPPPAPSIQPSTTVTPGTATQPPQTPAKPQPRPVQTEAPAKPIAKANKPRSKPRPGTPRHNPSNASTVKPTTPAGSTTVARNITPAPRITVEPGSLPDPEGSISSSIPHSQSTDDRRSTSELLQSTEANLRSVTRVLTEDEQSTVGTIRAFVAQSHAASKDGDLVRAHNLALKAHLLSDELAKR